MSLVIQAFWVLFFYLLGQGISFLTAGILPGSVIGMLLLFIALNLGYIKEKQVAQVSNVLLKNMVLFFLPAAVGLITTLKLVMDNMLSIATATLVSTTAVIITVGLIQQRMKNKTQKHHEL